MPTTSHVARIAMLIAATFAGLAMSSGAATAATAPDPLAADVWALDGDGPMGVASAWDQTVGGEVVVAVLDTGVDLDHPDLVDNLWHNPREVHNGRDDDGNGYVDDIRGVNIVARNGNPDDDNGHGTHVAGILGARGGNGIGTAGVAWRVRIMAVKVLDSRAGGDTAGVAAGIDYAVANGARILNLSLAAAAPSSVLEEAIARAEAAGVLVVAAAGNAGVDLGLRPAWPAVLGHSNILAVTASTSSGILSSIASFGSAVDLTAPGESILATARGGGYEWRTGTSMAAPMAAGAAALVSAASGQQDGRALRTALVDGARRTGLPVSAGALDVSGALRRVIPGDRWAAPVGTPAPAGAATPAARTKKKARKKAKKSAASCTTSKKASSKKKKAKRSKSSAKRKKVATRSARATSSAKKAKKKTSAKSKKKTCRSKSSKKGKSSKKRSKSKKSSSKKKTTSAKQATRSRARSRSTSDGVVPVAAA